jgi:hypothetical protein
VVRVLQHWGRQDRPIPGGAQFVGIKRLTPTEVADLKVPIIQSPNLLDLYYLQPDDLDMSKDRCLIHPCFDDPEEHLVFDEKGMAAAKDGSVKGQHSAEVYNLCGEDLITARFVEQQALINEFLDMMIAISGTAEKKGRRHASHGRHSEKRAKYSAAALTVIARRLLPPLLPAIGV